MANENTDKMAAWFDGRELPEGPIRIEPGIIIHDAYLYVSRNLAALRDCDDRKYGDGRRMYSIHWMMLYKLKKFIEPHE